MFLRIPHARRIEAIEIAEEIYFSNALARLTAKVEFTGEDLARQLTLIDEAQRSTLKLYQFSMKGMPEC